MSKLVRLASIAGIAALSTLAAHAADSVNLNVTASVTGTCKLTSVPTMAFGALDPAAGTNATAGSNVIYKCTKGTSPSGFTVGGSTSPYTGSLAGATSGNTDVIPFKVTWTNPTTAGTGLGASITGVTVALSGSIQGTDYVNVTADNYSATVADAINP